MNNDQSIRLRTTTGLIFGALTQPNTQPPSKVVPIVDPNQLLTREQAAEYLGVQPQTLAVWAMKKNRAKYKLPFAKIGTCIRYRRSDLDAFIEASMAA